MDFGNAALLAFSIFGIVKLLDKAIPTLRANALAFIVVLFAVGQADVRVVAHSDWGVKQVVDGISLNNMNEWSLGLVGFALTGLAVFGNVLLEKAIPSIGENQPTNN